MSGKTEQDGKDMRLELEDINMDDLEDTAFLNGNASQGGRQKKKISWTHSVLRNIGLIVEVAGIFKACVKNNSHSKLSILNIT